MKTIITAAAEETEKEGAKLAQELLDSGKRMFIALYGDLGAGKTVFVRGFAGVISPGSRVKSPTYTIVNEYRKGKTPLFHFDLYRLGETAEAELEGFGFEEYLENGICIAEWSENLGEMMPDNTVRVNIEKLSDSERKITIDY